MSAKIIDIAEAVKDELKIHEFSQTFTAERGYQPVYELPDMKTLKVSIIPKGVEIESASRTETWGDYKIDIAVQKKFAVGDNDELDALTTLVQEIADYMTMRNLQTASGTALWLKTENLPVFSPEHMEQYRQFTSTLTMTYRI